MKPNLRSVRKQRKYSEEFKNSIVSDFESGKYSVPELEKLHGIPNGTIYNWIYKFSTFNKKGYRVVEHKDSSGKSGLPNKFGTNFKRICSLLII